MRTNRRAEWSDYTDREYSLCAMRSSRDISYRQSTTELQQYTVVLLCPPRTQIHTQHAAVFANIDRLLGTGGPQFTFELCDGETGRQASQQTDKADKQTNRQTKDKANKGQGKQTRQDKQKDRQDKTDRQAGRQDRQTDKTNLW